MLSTIVIWFAVGLLAVVGSWAAAYAIIAKGVTETVRPSTVTAENDRTLVGSGASL